MENASKALIIAGAILLSILIIALGIYVFNMAKSATNTDQLEGVEKQTFNSSFSTYEGKRLGSEVSELINVCISNATKNSDADDRLPDIIYIDSGATKHVNINGTDVQESATFSTASGENMKVGGVIEAVGLEKTSTMSLIQSDSSDNGINNMGKLRNQLAPKHYYNVKCHNDEQTGLVDCILIKY